ncbi:hypothetical protein FC093_15180 [Ilyomonas limi]|uniref:Uncharacterized protein n=1 Tax=Ilyomonas limi TaxID=2575867 RepID=A0A4U3KZH1_9BACT|nr:hypothetical protein [Ilyomonas limi]TKK67224.1 hypothetical protein FC093_15180 [Ilyomonas limi]
MKKYQVIISFEITEEFMQLVPPHRTYIGYLINKCIVDCYLVSMESQSIWITFSALSKEEIENTCENLHCILSGLIPLKNCLFTTGNYTGCHQCNLTDFSLSILFYPNSLSA